MASQAVNSSWEPLRLTHVKPSFNNHEFVLASRNDLWHKFIIFDVADYEMEEILDAILAMSHPEPIFAVMYEVDSQKKATFLAKGCLQAIDSLVTQGLQIALPDGESLKMDIVLGFVSNIELQIHPNRLISDVLTSRWDATRKILNLESFHTDPGLCSVYCPLSSLAVLLFVLKFCKNGIGLVREKKIPVRELILRNNKIQGMMLYERLFNHHLVKVDLSFNEIESIDSLRYFSEFKITEVHLDGNPVCGQFTSTEDYIHAVKWAFPFVQKLDGVLIDIQQKCIPYSHPFYLPDDVKPSLVRQFIQHYFTLFDQRDRTVLHGLYESEAVFSVTFGEIANPRHRQLIKILSMNRNLLKLVDYSRCYKCLLTGSAEIVNCLRRFSPTYHDYKSFTVDVMHHGPNYLVLTVQGAFFYREFPISLLFNRNFILVEREDNEYRIVNDQYHIRSGYATMLDGDDIAKLSFTNIPQFEPQVMSYGEKNDLLKFLSNVTTMNLEYCRQYLLDARWDLRAAIAVFMKAYSVNDVPPEAFS